MALIGHTDYIGGPATLWTDAVTAPAAGAGAFDLTSDPWPSDTDPIHLLCFEHSAVQIIGFHTQMPHGWKPESEVRPHVHFVPLADPVATQSARFIIYYAWAPINGSALTGQANETVDVTIEPGDLNKHRIIGFSMLTPPAGSHESIILSWAVARAGTDPADTYTTDKAYGTVEANIGLLSFDVHYQLEKEGSISEFPGVDS
jgi:hypothetical protein